MRDAGGHDHGRAANLGGQIAEIRDIRLTALVLCC